MAISSRALQWTERPCKEGSTTSAQHVGPERGRSTLARERVNDIVCALWKHKGSPGLTIRISRLRLAPAGEQNTRQL